MKTLTNRGFRLFSSQNPKPPQNFTVSLFPGDGIGPEISSAVRKIFEAMKLPITWKIEQIQKEKVNEEGDMISPETLQSLKANKFALKGAELMFSIVKWNLIGPFGTQIGTGHRSINVTLRKKLNLYANVRPCKSILGVKTPYENVDLITIRENTEGEYSGLEHEVCFFLVKGLNLL